MTTIQTNIKNIRLSLPDHVQLVCVSKFHNQEEIMEAYQLGEREFAESHVQELIQKRMALPQDIHWHMIGHLQSNKVKQIVPFIHLIQSVDSLHLMEVIEKEAAKINRVIDILLEVHVAKEPNKTGLSEDELIKALKILPKLTHINVRGIMGMATLTDDEQEIRRCFHTIKQWAQNNSKLNNIISMGMTHDYPIAITEGSNMIRIGTAIFGRRNY